MLEAHQPVRDVVEHPTKYRLLDCVPVREHDGHVRGGAADGRHSVVLEARQAVRDILGAQPHVEGLRAERAPGGLLALVQAALELLRVQARCILLLRL